MIISPDVENDCIAVEKAIQYDLGSVVTNTPANDYWWFINSVIYLDW